MARRAGRRGRVKSHGWPRLRYTIPGWGALNVSAGTPRRRMVRRLREMTRALIEEGRYDYLALLREKEITPLRLLTQLGGGSIHTLPPAGAFRPVAETVAPWIAGLTATARHKVNCAFHLKRLLALDGAARPADFPGLLTRLRVADEARGAFRSYNYARAVALAYLRDHGGQRTETYTQTLAVRVLPTTRKRQGHPCTPDEAWGLACDLGLVWGRVWLAQCLTGMGNEELWGAWSTEDGGYHIAGTKRAGRNRLVPALCALARPPLGLEAGVRLYRKALRAASGGKVQPYDARRTYAKWLALAGVDRVHQDALMGHGPATMTELYQRGNVAPYLAGIGAQLAAVVRAVTPATRARVVATFGAGSAEAEVLA